MAVNDFKPFATAVGANVITQAEYEALVTTLANGFSSGTADSNKLNKVWRQSAIMAAVLAQLIVDQTAQNALDDGTTATLLANLKAAVSSLSTAPTLASIDAAVGGGAMTLTVNPQSVTFRDVNPGSGAVHNLNIPIALTTVISNGSTGGSVSGALSRIYVAAINNAGTPEIAWVNANGATVLDEDELISTLAEGGTGNADAINQWYSTNAVSNVAYRILGFVESTQATAGNWATPPSTIQGAGGQAIVGTTGLGATQDWNNMYLASASELIAGETYTIASVGTTNFALVGASANTVGTVFTATGQTTGTGTATARNTGINYQNTTGRPIMVWAVGAGGAGFVMRTFVDKVNPPVKEIGGGGNYNASGGPTFIVPPGRFYRVDPVGTYSGLVSWFELSY